MIRLLKNTQFQSLVGIFILLAVLLFVLFQWSVPAPDEARYAIGQWWQGWRIKLLSPGMEWWLAAIGLVVQSLIFGVVVEKNNVLYKNTYLPVMMFSLFGLVFPEQMHLSIHLFANLFMILAIAALFRVQGREKALPFIINTGLSLGVALILVPQTVFFVLLFLLGIVLFKPLRVADLLQFFFGLLVPPYFLALGLFLTDQKEVLFTYINADYWTWNGPVLMTEPIFLGFLIFIALFLLIIFFRLQQNFYKNTVRTRKYQQFMLAYTITAIAMFLFSGQPVRQNLIFLSAPLSVFLTYYFLPDKRIILKELIFYVLIAFVAIIHLNIF